LLLCREKQSMHVVVAYLNWTGLLDFFPIFLFLVMERTKYPTSRLAPFMLFVIHFLGCC
jgi:hypothetical protein